MTNKTSAADYIEPLHINGMRGRMMFLPARHKNARNILVIYGHHSSLERWWGLSQNFNIYGAVTVPDLPGFGGMDSFYTIGKPATLDNYADYMAAFIKMRYRRKKVSIVGISFGFLVATRMLQRYPELASKVEVLVSAMGFMHRDNFKFSPARYRFYKYLAEVVSIPPFPIIFRHTALSERVLRAAYARTNNAKHKFKQANNNPDIFNAMMDVEVTLWHKNDVRTHMRTTVEMLTVNNCEKNIDLPVWHVFTPHDNYFDNEVIEQQMRVVFADFFPASLQSKTHAPSVIATKKEAAAFIPRELRSALRQSASKEKKRA
ncbi:alpha/beta hydrolase [Candidatus Saccharibacteria bacterium]|nr:MAG: alpha/beta hydrolase [Candidatus Saccharibacteria bacterium]